MNWGAAASSRRKTCDHPSDTGDPVAYAKTTSIDSHYHDCDEYWIVLEGAATVVVGDRHMKVAAGDCVPIGMGHHHDLPTRHGAGEGRLLRDHAARARSASAISGTTPTARPQPAPERI